MLMCRMNSARKKKLYDRKKHTYLIRDWKGKHWKSGLRAKKGLKSSIEPYYPPFRTKSNVCRCSTYVKMTSVTLCLRSLSTISSKEVIPTLLDFECYWTGFLDEHCGVLTVVFCDLTIFKMKMSTSTLISFSSLFFCSDVTFFAEPQAFSKKGRILVQSSLQVESLDVLYLTNRFHMLPCIYY